MSGWQVSCSLCSQHLSTNSLESSLAFLNICWPIVRWHRSHHQITHQSVVVGLGTMLATSLHLPLLCVDRSDDGEFGKTFKARDDWPWIWRKDQNSLHSWHLCSACNLQRIQQIQICCTLELPRVLWSPETGWSKCRVITRQVDRSNLSGEELAASWRYLGRFPIWLSCLATSQPQHAVCKLTATCHYKSFPFLAISCLRLMYDLWLNPGWVDQ